MKKYITLLYKKSEVEYNQKWDIDLIPSKGDVLTIEQHGIQIQVTHIQYILKEQFYDIYIHTKFVKTI